jgi:hypothetical protein
VVHKMAVPMAQWWDSYPISSDVREREQGGVNGSLQGRSGRWILSSDIGSEFMFLDGLTDAWQIDRSAELKAAADAGIDRFLKMDVLAVQAQTHATLTTSRALLRMYTLSGEARLLRAVEELYALYRRVAMTENYANYNWFGRPDTWTEPCAVIDSFIVAMQLWQFTAQPQYLEDAQLIWFNGVGHGQRANGGFGCDSCAGVGNAFLKMSNMYEAYICCTMRGGEGHSFAIQAAYHTRPGELAVTFYNDSNADIDLGSGTLTLQQSTQYPYDGTVQFKVLASSLDSPMTLRLFAPSWMSNLRLRLNGQRLPSRMERGFLVAQVTLRAGDIIRLESALNTWVRPTRNPHSLRGYHVIHAGPLILGHEGEKEILLPKSIELIAHSPGRFQVRGRELLLARINDLNELPAPSWDPLDPTPPEPDKREQLSEQLLTEAPSARRQVLFRQV